MSTTTNPRRAGREPGLDLRTTLGHVTQRAPRRLGRVAAAILFVVLVVVALVALFQTQNDRVEVLVVKNPVAAGQVVEAADVGPAQVAGVSGAVLAADVDTVVGKRAAGGLVEGQVLTEAALTEALVPAAGQRLVAIRLGTGRVPGGLAPGDLVDVLAVPPDGDPGSNQQLNQPVKLAESARVDSLGETPDSAVVVTVLVTDAQADPIAAHSATGQVSIVQAPVGEG